MTAAWHDPIAFTARRLAARPLHEGGDQRLDVGGGQLRVRVLGEGPPLVILPDPPNVIEHYEALLPRLAKEHRVICFELPGFGFNRPPADYGFRTHDTSALLAATLGALKVRGATLSCACVGAHSALLMCRQRPELVSRILLHQFQAFDAAQAWVQTVNVFGTLTTPWVGQLLMGLGSRIVAHGWYDVSLPDEVPREPYREHTKAALKAGAGFPLASAFQSFSASEAPPLPEGLDATVIWGGSDPCHVDSDPRSALAVLPGARFIELPEVGHFPDLERPDWFLELIRGDA